MGLSKRRARLLITVATSFLLSVTSVIGCQSLIGLSDYARGPVDSSTGDDAATLDAGAEDATEDVVDPPPNSNPAQWATSTLSCNTATEGCFTASNTMYSGIAPDTTVIDNVTKLHWRGNALKVATTFEAAVSVCGNDRLPTRIELVALMQSSIGSGNTRWQLPDGFSVPSSVTRFWTASPTWPFVAQGQEFWSLDIATMISKPGLPGSTDKTWGVLCITQK